MHEKAPSFSYRTTGPGLTKNRFQRIEMNPSLDCITGLVKHQQTTQNWLAPTWSCLRLLSSRLSLSALALNQIHRDGNAIMRQPRLSLMSVVREAGGSGRGLGVTETPYRR
jgi:hypothetical protein